MGYFDAAYFDAAYFETNDNQPDALVTVVGRSLRRRRQMDVPAASTITGQSDDEFVAWFT